MTTGGPLTMHGVSSNVDELVVNRSAIQLGIANVFVRRSFKVVRRMALTILIAIVLLASYLTYWALSHRLMTSAPVMIDRRTSQIETPYYIKICAALADNPVGFPGHCYVVWESALNEDFLSAPSAGYVPNQLLDQLPSLWTHVPGMVARNSARGNLRNLSVLTVIVDRAEYEKTQHICDTWNTDKFQAGVRDCVAFANAIATELNLTTPATTYKYPQDYLRELKRLNSESNSHSRN
jgi:hypothetical protein